MGGPPLNESVFVSTNDPTLCVCAPKSLSQCSPTGRGYGQKFGDFFESYAKAHKKLSEVGSKFEPEGGVKVEQASVAKASEIEGGAKIEQASLAKSQ